MPKESEQTQDVEMSAKSEESPAVADVAESTGGCYTQIWVKL